MSDFLEEGLNPMVIASQQGEELPSLHLDRALMIRCMNAVATDTPRIQHNLRMVEDRIFTERFLDHLRPSQLISLYSSAVNQYTTHFKQILKPFEGNPKSALQQSFLGMLPDKSVIDVESQEIPELADPVRQLLSAIADKVDSLAKVVGTGT